MEDTITIKTAKDNRRCATAVLDAINLQLDIERQVGESISKTVPPLPEPVMRFMRVEINGFAS
jgi:hypothetical protein